MINKGMANTRNKEPTSGDCDQEAKILLKELNRIVYSKRLKGFEEMISLRKIYEEGSASLKNFMFRNIVKEKK